MTYQVAPFPPPLPHRLLWTVVPASAIVAGFASVAPSAASRLGCMISPEVAAALPALLGLMMATMLLVVGSLQAKREMLLYSECGGSKCPAPLPRLLGLAPGMALIADVCTFGVETMAGATIVAYCAGVRGPADLADARFVVLACQGLYVMAGVAFAAASWPGLRWAARRLSTAVIGVPRPLWGHIWAKLVRDVTLEGAIASILVAVAVAAHAVVGVFAAYSTVTLSEATSPLLRDVNLNYRLLVGVSVLLSLVVVLTGAFDAMSAPHSAVDAPPERIDAGSETA